jgi:hypothetical protein
MNVKQRLPGYGDRQRKRRTPMTRKSIFANAALTLTAGITAATRPAAAQSTTKRMTVTIPFAFSADKRPMPAGTYTVEISTDNLISFSDAKTGQSSIVMVRTDSFTPNKGGTRLTFRRVSGQTYLSQVWVAGSSRHSELISHPKALGEIAKLSVPDATFEIAAAE